MHGSRAAGACLTTSTREFDGNMNSRDSQSGISNARAVRKPKDASLYARRQPENTELRCSSSTGLPLCRIIVEIARRRWCRGQTQTASQLAKVTRRVVSMGANAHLRVEAPAPHRKYMCYISHFTTSCIHTMFGESHSSPKISESARLQLATRSILWASS